jgi:hypothetical protein
MLEQLEKDPHTFYGNMGQPDTPEEFKNRYEVWPPGYDKDGINFHQIIDYTCCAWIAKGLSEY